MNATDRGDVGRDMTRVGLVSLLVTTCALGCGSDLAAARPATAASCAQQWSPVWTSSVVKQRPPASSTTTKLRLQATPGPHGARVELNAMLDLKTRPMRPGDAPVDHDKPVTSFVELQNKDGRVLFTRLMSLVDESLEIPPGLDVHYDDAHRSDPCLTLCDDVACLEFRCRPGRPRSVDPPRCARHRHADGGGHPGGR